MTLSDSIFGAYDVRGTVPDRLDDEGATRIARAFAHVCGLKKMAVGRDVRTSGETMQPAILEGLSKVGVEVVDLGVISTDMLYFATGSLDVDGGIAVSASHNPKEYNGLKMILKNATPMSEAQYAQVKKIALSSPLPDSAQAGSVATQDLLEPYLDHLLSFIHPAKILPLKIAVNCNFGAVSRPLKALAERLFLDITYLNDTPDGSFPKGRPDPLIPANRAELEELLKEGAFDIGVAWDADADRCFFLTAHGDFIEGCFTNALLAEILLAKHAGATIVTDPRAYWMVEYAVKKGGGVFALCRPGHIFMKAKMRADKAIFGGELSGHMYFKKNFYADNGLIPFLIVLEHLSTTGKSLDQLLRPYTSRFYVSGERNFPVKDPDRLLRKIEEEYSTASQDHLDGLSLTFGTDWRMNLRKSNTEPLVRLNVEARDRRILDEKTAELIGKINGFKG